MSDVFADITEILKTDYEPTMEKAISEQNFVLSQIKKNSGVRMNSAKSFEVKVLAYGANSYFYDPDTDSDLSSHAQTYDTMSSSLKALANDAFFKDIDLQVKGAGAAVDLAIDTKNALVAAAARALNRCLVATTKGQLALVNGTSGAATDIAFDNAVVDAFKPGQLITIDTDECTVSTVNSETEITVTPSVTVADNDVIYNRGYANEADGLANLIVNSGTIQGVTKATNYWAHSFIDSDAETINTADLLANMLKVNRYGKGVSYSLMGESLWSKIGADLTALKLVNLTSGQGMIDLPGGWSGLKFAAGAKAVPLMAEPDMVYGSSGEIYNVTNDAVTLASFNNGGKFLQGSNGVLDRVSKRPKWEITLLDYVNFAVKNFKGVGALKSKTI